MNRTLHIFSALLVFCLFSPRLAAQGEVTAKDRLMAQGEDYHKQALELQRQGKYAEAIPLAKKALDICEQTFGENHTSTAGCLVVLGELYKVMGKYATAEPLLKRGLAICERAFGPDHLATGICLNNLAELYLNIGNYAAAEPLYKRSLAIREKVLGVEHPETATNLNNLAELYREIGNNVAAEPLYKRSLAIREKVLGAEHPDTAQSLNNLGLTYSSMGNHAAAEPLYKRSLAIYEKTLGAEHPATGICLNNLAAFYVTMGNHAAAEPLYQRSVAITEKLFGPDHPSTAMSLGNLGKLYCAMGNCAAAEPLLKRSLAIYEKALGPDHPSTATSLNNLAAFYVTMGNYKAAEPLYKRSLAIYEKAFGADHPHTATGLNNLAGFYNAMGNYAAAERLYKRSLAVREKTLRPNHPDTANSLNNLAGFYYAMGNYAAAEPLLKRSLAIYATAFGAEHPQTATSLNNLAVLYVTMGNHAAAEPLHKLSLAIREKVLGAEHPETATSLNNLATLHHAMGNYAVAELLCKRSLAIYEKTLGAEHPATGKCLNNLAEVYVAMGNYAAAEPLCRRDVQIQEKVLGPDHPDTASGLGNLACCQVAAKKPTEALMSLQKVWRNRETSRDQVFAFASELEQAAYNKAHNHDFHGSCSLVAEHLAENPAARRFAFSVVLSSKGAMLEALSQRQADVLGSTAPELKPLLAEWQTVGAQLSKAIMATPPPGQLTNHLARIAELEKSKEAAEQSLARASARFANDRQASRVAPSDVARVLASGSALVEFAKYRSFRFSATGKEEKWGDWNYVALVLRGGGSNAEPDVALVRLGSADKVEAAVRKWRKASAPDEQGRRSDKAALDAASQELAALVWNPIVPALAGCRKLYLSPDGELAFVSFAALPGTKPDSFVIDDYDISYVATGRDLVRQGGGQDSASLLVGAPDFGEQQGTTTKLAKDTKPEAELLAMRSGISDLRSFTALSFAPLPGTRSEVENVARLLQQRDTLRRSETVATVPVVLTGTKADEATVKAAKHPGILHLATHGFFLPDSGLNDVMSGNDRFQSQPSREMANATAGKLWRQMKLKNPMHRSGIALAGANNTIRGRREAGGNDGILTAEEVAGMDLWGTKMVVISACESGLGEAKGGEGVFGLRRAFTMAGAQSLVMTLWAVSDEATRELMESLYRHLPEQRTPQRALLAAQREWIAKKRAAGLYPHPVHWAGFVASGIGMALEK